MSAIRPWLERVSRHSRAVLPSLTVGLAVLVALRRIHDPDTWWHLASGRWILEHHALPPTDPFSFTASDHPWINLQWLYDLVLYGLYRAGGVDVLVIAAALAYGLAFALLIRNLRLALGPVGSSLIALWILWIAEERFSVRPEMATFVLMQAVLWLCATAPRHDGRRLWLLPVLMILWVNTHALFVLGLFIIGCYAGAALAARTPLLPAAWRESSGLTPEGTRRLLLWGGVAMLATAVNPYLVDGVVFPFTLLSRIGEANAAYLAIGELQRPFSSDHRSLYAYKAFLVFAVIVVTLAALLTARGPRREVVALRRGKPTRRALARTDALADRVAEAATKDSARLDVAGLLIFGGFVYLSLLARRNTALFAFATAPFVALCVAVLTSRLSTASRRWRSVYGEVGALALPALLVAAGFFVVTNGYYRWSLNPREFGLGILEAKFPIRASAFARELHLPPQLYNDIGGGGYLSWDRPVDGGVYIDGRLEVYDIALLRSSIAGRADPPQWQLEADRLGVRTVMLLHQNKTNGRLIKWLLESPDWTLVYFDEVAVLFVRRAGSESVIDAAGKRFAEADRETVARLRSPVSSWQWHTGRMEGVWAYASLVNMMGYGSDSAYWYERLLDLGPAAENELEIRIGLASYYAQAGALAAAREQLQRAARLAPGNSRIAQVESQIGRQRP